MGRKLKTTEQYAEELASLGKPFYPIEPYVKAVIPIMHECVNSHQWKVSPHEALKGYNCPTCTKLGIERTTVYHVSFESEGQTFYKVGITNTPLTRRFRTKWYELNMQEIWQIDYPNRYLAKAKEQQLLGDNISYLVNTGALAERGGDTETLTKQLEKPLN